MFKKIVCAWVSDTAFDKQTSASSFPGFICDPINETLAEPSSTAVHVNDYIFYNSVRYRRSWKEGNKANSNKLATPMGHQNPMAHSAVGTALAFLNDPVYDLLF